MGGLRFFGPQRLNLTCAFLSWSRCTVTELDPTRNSIISFGPIFHPHPFTDTMLFLKKKNWTSSEVNAADFKSIFYKRFKITCENRYVTSCINHACLVRDGLAQAEPSIPVLISPTLSNSNGRDVGNTHTLSCRVRAVPSCRAVNAYANVSWSYGKQPSPKEDNFGGWLPNFIIEVLMRQFIFVNSPIQLDFWFYWSGFWTLSTELNRGSSSFTQVQWTVGFVEAVPYTMTLWGSHVTISGLSMLRINRQSVSQSKYQGCVTSGHTLISR